MKWIADFPCFQIGSHFQKVRVPTSHNTRDIDIFLDEIFEPVLQNSEFTDDDEPSVRLDPKKLAASIKGGRGKASKNAPESVRKSILIFL